MCTRGSPDIYTLSPRACGPRASGVYIRQTTRAHDITIKYIYIYIYTRSENSVTIMCLALRCSAIKHSAIIFNITIHMQVLLWVEVAILKSSINDNYVFVIMCIRMWMHIVSYRAITTIMNIYVSIVQSIHY